MIFVGVFNFYYGFVEKLVILMVIFYIISFFLFFVLFLDQYFNNYKFYILIKQNLIYYIVMLVKLKDESGIIIDG